jgi:hypothetical protein
MRTLSGLAALTAALLVATRLGAQENYEIQVYPSETLEKRTTIFELHSNWTGAGRRTIDNGVLPTHGAFHETLEITHGYSEIFEVGFYVFTSARSGDGWQYAGSHIRPRVRAPESWRLPVGLSLSSEFGWVSKAFDANSWTAELRPIVDQTVGKLYWSVNLALGWAVAGPDAGLGVEGVNVSPNVKLSYELHPKVAAGLEYYGSSGTLARTLPMTEQSHLVYPTLDLMLAPEWELNVGYGIPLAGSGDHSILKVIVGRRFPF